MKQIHFAGGVHPDIPVEVIDLATRVRRSGPGSPNEVQRLSLGLMIVVLRGTGFHTVDFERIPLAAGRVVFARPGQVQQWEEGDDLEALLVVARPELCRLDGWFPGEASYSDLGEASMSTANDLLACLIREQERFEPDAASNRLLGSLFESLQAVLDRAGATLRQTDLPEPYVLFRSAVERDVARSRDAREYMEAIGFSERTINRACLRVAGVSAKGVLDQRIVLEARRLLAHTDDSVSSIASRLGFSEAANFNKFFARVDGQRPTQFRAGLRSGGYTAGFPTGTS